MGSVSQSDTAKRGEVHGVYVYVGVWVGGNWDSNTGGVENLKPGRSRLLSKCLLESSRPHCWRHTSPKSRRIRR
jgi:hypothetical protein